MAVKTMLYFKHKILVLYFEAFTNSYKLKIRFFCLNFNNNKILRSFDNIAFKN